MEKLLTLAIPTYNRCQRLEHGLANIAAFAPDLLAQIELVVSDNASTDGTIEMLKRMQSKLQFKSVRNDSNLGFTRNALNLVLHHTTTEFLWIVGDDDLVVENGLRAVLESLRRRPGIDFYYLTNSFVPEHCLKLFAIPLREIEEHRNGRDDTEKFGGREIPFFDLISPRVDYSCLGAVMCSVFRVEMAKAVAMEVIEACQRAGTSLFSSLEYAYPHSVMWGRSFSQARAAVIPETCIAVGVGSQAWLCGLPLLRLLRDHEVIEMYQTQGLPLDRAERCRAVLIQGACVYLHALYFDESTTGRELFSFRQFVWRCRHHPVALFKELWKFSRLASASLLRRGVYGRVASKVK